MKIIILDEDIKQGKRGVCNQCPLALAIMRQCGTENVNVLPGFFCNELGKVIINTELYTFSADIAQCIRLYDYGDREFVLKEVILTKYK